MKTAVLIPAHNAGQTIYEVAKKIKTLGFPVIVVDDGSMDGTFKDAQAAGAVVLKNEKNLGKGAALRKGFTYILENDFDAVITMDADGQHEPESLNDFIKKAEATNAGLVLGDRMHKPMNMPAVRIVTNRLMSDILSWKIGQFVPDTQCGFRLIRKGLLEKLKLHTSRYEIESEIFIQAGRMGARIESVPIRSIYTGQTSRINPIVDTWRFVRLMLRAY